MSFFDNIKVFNKKSSIRKEVDDIIGKLPSSDIIAKDILNKKETITYILIILYIFQIGKMKKVIMKGCVL